MTEGEFQMIGYMDQRQSPFPGNALVMRPCTSLSEPGILCGGYLSPRVSNRTTATLNPLSTPSAPIASPHCNGEAKEEHFLPNLREEILGYGRGTKCTRRYPPYFIALSTSASIFNRTTPRATSRRDWKAPPIQTIASTPRQRRRTRTRT